MHNSSLFSSVPGLGLLLAAAMFSRGRFRGGCGRMAGDFYRKQ
jgi:hypothetical protein